MAEPLTHAEIEIALQNLPGWTMANDTISKSYQFKSFRQAVVFIMRLSFEAEEMNHHPEIVNVYSKVKISLNTHEAGGKVTHKDLTLAQKIEAIAHE